MSPHFARNSTTRRSVSASSYDQNGRRISQSANTSPTKSSSLRKELLEAVKNTNGDDKQMLDKLQKLLKQYSNLSFESDDTLVVTSRQKEEDKRSFRSTRKDSRPDVISRIPAPVVTK